MDTDDATSHDENDDGSGDCSDDAFEDGSDNGSADDLDNVSIDGSSVGLREVSADAFAGTDDNVSKAAWWQAAQSGKASQLLNYRQTPSQDFGDPQIYFETDILERTHRHASPWIRLLQIAPGSFPEPIRCTLLPRPLWDAGEYTALSYSWGDGRLTEQILLPNGFAETVEITVSKNLFDALRRLRYEKEPRNVWADAICIDQRNYEERAAQVSIMAQIYNQASNVNVWLGELPVEADEHLSDRETFWSLCWQISAWWTRLWVVQECAYSENCPIIMLGSKAMSYAELIERWKAVAEQVDLSDLQRDTFTDELKLLSTPFQIWLSQKENGLHRGPLLQRLREIRGRHCTDPHDRIYAVLSLINKDEAVKFRPDYQMPFSQLAEDVAYLLRSSPEWDEERDGHELRLWQFGAPQEPEHMRGSLLKTRYLERLRRAVEDSETERVRFLLQEHVPAEVKQYRCMDAVSIAARNGLEDILQIVIDADAELDKTPVRDQNLSHSLREAAAAGHENIVRMLIQAGAEVNALQNGTSGRGEYYYISALCAASSAGRTEVVKILIDHGADVNAKSTIGGNALHMASGDTGMIASQAASGNSRRDIVQSLIDHGADVNARDELRRTVLQVASRIPGNGHIVQILIDHGADINAKGGVDGTALQIASRSGHKDIVQLLIDHGADVNAREDVSGTALHAASRYGHRDITQILINHGANINARANYRESTVQMASRNGHEEIVKMLRDAGARELGPDADSAPPPPLSPIEAKKPMIRPQLDGNGNDRRISARRSRLRRLFKKLFGSRVPEALL